jgi:hypothetical protein
MNGSKKSQTLLFYDSFHFNCLHTVRRRYSLLNPYNRALMIDWDLEAPGVDRFFDFETDALIDHSGLIDLLEDYKENLAHLAHKLDESEPFQFVDIQSYIVDIYPDQGQRGKFFLLPAGKRLGENFKQYATLIKKFNWHDFYKNWEGEFFFEWFRWSLGNLAEVILIDSRTGVTEMGGACTYQLADVVVMLCTPNE